MCIQYDTSALLSVDATCATLISEMQCAGYVLYRALVIYIHVGFPHATCGPTCLHKGEVIGSVVIDIVLNCWM